MNYDGLTALWSHFLKVASGRPYPGHGRDRNTDYDVFLPQGSIDTALSFQSMTKGYDIAIICMHRLSGRTVGITYGNYLKIDFINIKSSTPPIVDYRSSSFISQICLLRVN